MAYEAAQQDAGNEKKYFYFPDRPAEIRFEGGNATVEFLDGKGNPTGQSLVVPGNRVRIKNMTFVIEYDRAQYEQQQRQGLVLDSWDVALADNDQKAQPDKPFMNPPGMPGPGGGGTGNTPAPPTGDSSSTLETPVLNDPSPKLRYVPLKGSAKVVKRDGLTMVTLLDRTINPDQVALVFVSPLHSTPKPDPNDPELCIVDIPAEFDKGQFDFHTTKNGFVFGAWDDLEASNNSPEMNPIHEPART
jgi:hypothetical protein